MHQEKHDFQSCEQQLRELLASEHLDSSSSDVLFELLDDYIGAATESQMDSELVSACFARLRELHPEKPKFDKEAGLAKLVDAVQSHREERSKKVNRTSRFVSILVAVLSLLIVAATAFGVNPFESIFRFAETVSFRLTPSGEMVLPSGQESEYNSLQEALDANGVDVKLPQWIPPKFSLSTVKVLITDDTSIFTAVFSNEEKELQIDVTDYSDSVILTYEKEVGGKTYEANGQSYHIIPNSKNLNISWTDGDYAMLVSGQITEADAMHMIDAIS